MSKRIVYDERNHLGVGLVPANQELGIAKDQFA